MLRHSALNLPLKLSMKALSVGFPGREKSSSAPFCLSLDNDKPGLRRFYERGHSRPSSTVHNLAANQKAIARHWLKADEATLKAMSGIVTKLAPLQLGMSMMAQMAIKDLGEKTRSGPLGRVLILVPNTGGTALDATLVGDPASILNICAEVSGRGWPSGGK